MKGVVKTAAGLGNVELRDVAEPTAGQGQVVLEVAYAGICGTDLHIYLDEYRCAPPVVLGHEVAGTVANVGPGVEGIRTGARVTTETFFYTCGRCAGCIAGRVNLCPHRKSIGTHVNGAFARYLLVPAAKLHPVPDALDLRAAAMTEPLACVVHALQELTSISAGDVVVVSGPGPIGLLCLQVARAAGARTILCGADGDEGRLEIGRTVGASFVVRAAELAALVEEVTSGLGADMCVEAAGAAGSLRQCLQVVRRGGAVVQVGLYGRPVEVDINLVPMKELNYVGTFGQVPTAWDRALALLASGQVEAAPLISDVVGLDEWERKFESLRAKRDCKVLLKP